jgi:hypothetical protein
VRAALASVTVLVLAACDRAPARVELVKEDVAPVAAPADTACVPAVAEKIGVRFVRVCPRATVDSSKPARPFWISVAPLGCSAGEHGTVACPPVTTLLQPPREIPELRAPSPMIAAVVEAYTAHKICTMRFAGRLPTRTERAHARAALGLASVVVSEPGAGRPFRLREIAEWVTARPCEQPTDLGPECKQDRYPIGAISGVSWSMLAGCTASPVASSAFVPVELGGECAARRGAEGSVRLPCFVPGLAFATSGPPPSTSTGFELSCEPPREGAEHPDDARSDIAAFRCVLPEWI